MTFKAIVPFDLTFDTPPDQYPEAEVETCLIATVDFGGPGVFLKIEDENENIAEVPLRPDEARKFAKALKKAAKKAEAFDDSGAKGLIAAAVASVQDEPINPQVEVQIQNAEALAHELFTLGIEDLDTADLLDSLACAGLSVEVNPENPASLAYIEFLGSR